MHKDYLNLQQSYLLKNWIPDEVDHLASEYTELMKPIDQISNIPNIKPSFFIRFFSFSKDIN